MKHFKLTNETIVNFLGVMLYRVELTIDCRWGKAGDKGGFVEKEKNISGDAWVSGDAQVYGNALVSGDAWVSGDAQVYGNALVYGDALVYGNAQVYGNALVYGDAWKKSPLQIQGSKNFFSVSSKTHISIGCHSKTFEEWRDNYKAIGKEEGYTPEEIEEYGHYIDLAFKLYRK